jgi:hypothetical protein
VLALLQLTEGIDHHLWDSKKQSFPHIVFPDYPFLVRIEHNREVILSLLAVGAIEIHPPSMMGRWPKMGMLVIVHQFGDMYTNQQDY